MYLLDTNVISELRKAGSGRADKSVVAWSQHVAPDSLYLSVLTVMELERGIFLLQRKDAAQYARLRDWMSQQVLPAFETRVLAVDRAVAELGASLQVPDPRPVVDALIAATALVHGLTIVSRNEGDFEGTGVRLFNPWRA